MPNKGKPHDNSKGMKIPPTRPPVVKARSALVKAESRADTKPKGNAPGSVRPGTFISMSPAEQVGFEAASKALLSLIRSNFDALRTSVKKTNEEAQHDQTTGGKAGEDLLAALDRLEVDYRKLLKGK